ncbi:hypothetical protein QGQ_0583, partial [Clostridioides difficile 342]
MHITIACILIVPSINSAIHTTDTTLHIANSALHTTNSVFDTIDIALHNNIT